MKKKLLFGCLTASMLLSSCVVSKKKFIKNIITNNCIVI